MQGSASRLASSHERDHSCDFLDSLGFLRFLRAFMVSYRQLWGPLISGLIGIAGALLSLVSLAAGLGRAGPVSLVWKADRFIEDVRHSRTIEPL